MSVKTVLIFDVNAACQAGRKTYVYHRGDLSCEKQHMCIGYRLHVKQETAGVYGLLVSREGRNSTCLMA